MITLVSGVPGSGKSYYAVHFISTLSDDEKNKVIHNIDGLKIGINLFDYCKEKSIPVLSLFTEKYHDNDDSLHGYYFIIDECQKLFPKNFKNQDVIHFFDLHRHYMIDILLLTQDQKRVCPDITVHLEYYWRAVSDSANPLPGLFLYKKIVSGEEVAKKTLKKDKKVFALYKSAIYDKASERKKARPMLKYISLGILSTLLILFFGHKIISSKKQNNTSNQNQNTVPSDYNYNKNDIRNSRYSDNQQEDRETTTYNRFNTSHIDKIGGVLYPISTLTDRTGNYVILLGVMYEMIHFPYPVIKTRTGMVALLPSDVAQAQHNYIDELKLAGSIDPNENYYYVDNQKDDKKFDPES